MQSQMPKKKNTLWPESRGDAFRSGVAKASVLETKCTRGFRTGGLKVHSMGTEGVYQHNRRLMFILCTSSL